MAALETERLVVRVVYAGAPMAGKTASVRALMPLLKGPGAERLVMSPGEERGRTLFFDWADYDGGSFQGRPIHCQIASAPGQVALSDRRELILRGADAVILVVDSQSDGIERALQCHEEMAPWLEEAGRDAPIRLLLQCNKQDLPGALAPAELSRALGLDFGKDVYATSARTSKGLRAAFVAAVRVAVERARVLLERGLILGAAEIASGEELLERMQIEATLREPPAPPAVPARAAAAAARRVAPAAGARRAPAASAVSAPQATPRAAPGPATVARRAPATRVGSGRLQGRRGAAEASEARLARESERSSPPAAAREAPPAAARDPREPAHARARQDAEPTREARGLQVPRSRDSDGRAPPAAPSAPPLSVPAASAAEPERARPIPAIAPSLARDWTPAKGPRPAVMPASAFYARVGVPPVRTSGHPASSPFNEPEPVSDDEWVDPELAARAPVSLPSLPASSSSQRSAGTERSAAPAPHARPAIMPMGAYLASLPAPAAAAASTPTVTVAVRVTPPPAARGRVDSTGPAASAVRANPAARPAILPMSAYHALFGASAVSDGAQAPGWAPAAEAPQAPTLEPRAAAGERRATTATASEPPGSRRKISRSLRPAVIPASAWRGRLAAASEAIAAPPAARRAMWRGGTRPAVMPASAWFAAHADADAANDLEPEDSPARFEDSSRAAPRAIPPPGPLSEAPNTVVSGPGLPEGPPSEPLSSVISYGGVDTLPLSSPSPGFPLAEPQSDAVTGAAEEHSSEAPRLPGQVSPRATWPRANWRELVPLLSEPVTVRRDALGRWIGEIAPGWYARTLESATDLRSARRCLARAVLRQRTLQRYLSLPRCLALTEEEGRFWVWQIVFRVPTLAGTLGKLLDGDDPGAVADALLEAALGYLDARENFARAPEPLPLSLQALSSQAGRFVYSGLLPRSDVAPPRPGPDEEAAFRDALTKRWPELPAPSLDARAVVEQLERKAIGRLPDPIVEIIRGVLIRQ